jgi:N-acetylneuraminic acid mutarotase
MKWESTRLAQWISGMMALSVMCLSAFAATPLGTVFTFQGKLHDAGQPANGEYEFEFRLFDALTNGTMVGPVNTREEVAVSNGVFTVQLDFGAAAFDGNARWLEIDVRASGGEAATLVPRTPLTATPYAMMSSSVVDGAITANKLADGSVSGAKIAPGSIGGAQIADGAIGANHLGVGIINSTHISAGAVGATHIASGAVGAQQLASGAVTADKLGDGSALANLLSGGQSPIASGGIIFSESPHRAELLSAGFTLLSKIDLVTEAWRAGANAPVPEASVPISLNAGPGVWTGTEMLVWGGGANTGARLNPATATWTAISTNNAPSARTLNSAVWSGSQMIVWGGKLAGSATATLSGARYNPATDTWSPMSTVNAPTARSQHSAVWTGTEMLIWGGLDSAGNKLSTGARYNPTTDTWTAMTTVNAPAPRQGHTAVWDGSGMIVWGGGQTLRHTNVIEQGDIFSDDTYFVTNVLEYEQGFHTGARYNPANNSWTALTTNNAPSGRLYHSAVWTGTEMIVYGGHSETIIGFPIILPPGGISYSVSESPAEGGARYNPANNTWTPTSFVGAPEMRSRHTAVWTGSRMLIWGGGLGFAQASGASYNPANNSWAALSITNQPSLREGHVAVWTGTQMIIWGGGKLDGGLYNLAANSWTPTTPSADAAARQSFSSVWTGRELIIWGGRDENGLFVQSGFRYNPTDNIWTKLPLANAPSARAFHNAVWTGTEMIVWGGSSAVTELNDGARYNPVTDKWGTMTSSNAPTARRSANAVWTGTEMIVMGGLKGLGVQWSGGRCNPATDAWWPLHTNNAPTPRLTFALVWSGSEMILWGGDTIGLSYVDGGRFNPITGLWTPMSTTNAPPGRSTPGAVWAGKEMLVWGGGGAFGMYPNQGGRYNPVTDKWTPMSLTGAPVGRTGHSMVWDGTKLLVFGGETNGFPMMGGVGHIYVPEEDKWSPIGGNESPRSRHAAAWTGLEMAVWCGTMPIGGLTQSTRLYRPARTLYMYLRP